MAEGGRLERLRTAVEGVRSRSRPTTDPTRWLLIVGSVLFPMGILLVVLGWYGASRTPYLFEQVPYLISGGVLGVGLCIVGGFLYFGYWLTRLVTEGRARADGADRLLERIEELLSSGVPESSPAPARSGGARANGKLVATSKGTLLHRADCAVVAGRSGLRKIAAGTPGFELCRLCNPGEPAEAPALSK